jgi:pimeloyl-ACP methyl ester carboxylesterase
MTARWRTGTVSSGGEQIYYEVSGEDDLPAVLLTHGAGGSHASWFQQVPALVAEGFRVITWDCRGFGNSTFVSGGFGAAAAVADMAAVLDATGTPSVHLVGQSMGGWWVTAFTLAHPGRTHSLTLSNTVGGLWTTPLLDYVHGWFATRAANFGAEQRIGMHAAISPAFVERDPARAFLYQQLNTFHTPPMAAVGPALIGTSVAHEDLGATGVPVLVITSSEDALFPPQLVIDGAQRLGSASVVEIADAGHSAYFERPDLYNDALLAFLRSPQNGLPSSVRDQDGRR